MPRTHRVTRCPLPSQSLSTEYQLEVHLNEVQNQDPFLKLVGVFGHSLDVGLFCVWETGQARKLRDGSAVPERRV